MKRFFRNERPDAAVGGVRRGPGAPVHHDRCQDPSIRPVSSGLLPAAGTCPCGSIRQPY